jgi:hypothetical protein
MVILWWFSSFFFGEQGKKKGKGKEKQDFPNSQEEMLLKEHVSWISLGLNIRQHESWLRGSLREHPLSRSREPIANSFWSVQLFCWDHNSRWWGQSILFGWAHIIRRKLWQSCKRTGCQLQATSLEYQNWSLDRNERHCQTAVSEIREQAWWSVRLQC